MESKIDEEKFWSCIELIYNIPIKIRKEYDQEELQLHLIKKYLKQFELKDILTFQKILANKASNLYVSKIGEIFYLTAYKIKNRTSKLNYISTDGFLDFRLWIISLGKKHYETFLNFKTETDLMKYNLSPNNAYVSGLEYLVNDVYKEKNPSDAKSALSYCEKYGIEFYFDGDSEKLYNTINWDNLDLKYPNLFNKYQVKFN